MIIERNFTARFLSYFQKTMLVLALGVLALSVDPIPTGAQQPPRPQREGDKTAAPQIATTQAEVARGKYIVENVAMCPQCHTPRDDNGKLDRRHPLAGGAEFFQPPRPDPNWPLKTPRIGGILPALRNIEIAVRTELQTAGIVEARGENRHVGRRLCQRRARWTIFVVLLILWLLGFSLH